MGTQLKDLLEGKEIDIKELESKIIVIDAMNHLFQYLSSIRQRDGSLLTDSKGRVTSHLIGLFNRTTKLMSSGLKLAYVFDGKPPELKKGEIEKRAAVKKEALKKFKEAEEKEDIEEMRKYAARTSKLTPEMLEESKELLISLGLPVIQAPSEGEAQAAYIVKKGDAYAVGSQDADSLLNGATRLIRNLSISGRRKRGAMHITVKPELIELGEILNKIGIDNDQLIVLAMLVGTDYNPKGIPGIGPKNALKLVTKYGKKFEELFKEAKWDEHYSFKWKEVFDVIKKMPVIDDYKMQWNKVDKEKIINLLVEEHEFDRERVEGTLEKLEGEERKKQQKSLFEF